MMKRSLTSPLSQLSPLAQPAGVVVMVDNAAGCYTRIKNGPRMRAVADDNG